MAVMEGPLSKWTNVMQGWQYRWFVLDENVALLSYYTVSSSSINQFSFHSTPVQFILNYYIFIICRVIGSYTNDKNLTISSKNNGHQITLQRRGEICDNFFIKKVFSK